MNRKFLKFRILLLGVFFLAAFGVIGAKAIHLQIYNSPWLAKKASDQYEQSTTTSGKRGIIYDRNLRELAVSIEVTSIAAYPSQVKDAKTTAKALSKILKLEFRQIKNRLKEKKSFVWIKRQATPKEAQAVRDLGLPGIDFITEYKRFYPNTTLAAQTLGFTGLDEDGLEGLEFYYNRHLKGADRNITVLKDALGNGFSAGSVQAPNSSGNNLVLTIDSTIQYITESALKEAVDQYSARSAMTIVMQPETGEILAMAHYPLFNPNAFSNFDKTLWRNRTITDPFEPGSTMKLFSAAAALEYSGITLKDIFFCENGAYRIGKNVVHDIHRHGWLTIQQIIKYSSNIGAVKVGERVGPKKLYQMLRNFGFGEKTGIDCPGETTGSLSHYSTWSDIDTGAIAFGHGISASALQMVTAVSAIANGGILMKPLLVREITDQGGRSLIRFEPQPVRSVLSANTAGILRNIMKSVITEGGTGVNAALDGYTVGGKTATSRKLDENGKYSTEKHLASFIGFAPANNPAIAVLVVIDEPKEQYYGGMVAAPVFKKIAQETLNYLNVPHDSGATKLRVSRGNGARG